MKKVYFLYMGLLCLIFTGCRYSNVKQDNNIEQKVSHLINQMTLDEKIGQMCQSNGFGGIPDELKTALRNGEIGSILNEVDVERLNEIQKIAVEESRLGIPLLIGRDVVHGFKTIFPIPIGLAATWNPETVQQGAQIAAQEAWSSGVNWTFAPMIDISRDARWGRIAESFGEDPYLTSVMGVHMVKGFQGDDLTREGSIIACAKHFAAYGAAEGGRDYNSTLVPLRELRDVYFPPFKAAVDAGARSFMSGFNDIDGVPATGSKFLFRQVLRNEWQFDGFVVSDWASTYEMLAHGYAADKKEAALRAINAGINMEMFATTYKENIKTLLDEGLLSEKTINQAVREILRVKYELGLFDNPYVPEEKQYQFAKKEYLDAAQKAAVESMVLLKNKNKTLPIDKKVKSIALIGPMANQMYEQLGTWIFDGDSTLTVTPLAALNEYLGESKVKYASGLAISRTKTNEGFAKAIEKAKRADVVVFCGGEESILSGEAHSRADISLPGAQEELIKELHKTGKPLVLVVMAGRPLTIGEISDYADAVLYAWHPGTMGGKALVDVLFGDENPSGKLPVTFPKQVGQIPIYYNHKNTGRPANPASWTHIDDIPVKASQTSLGNESHYIDAGFKPLYPFGYGLSYTRFAYDKLTLDKASYAIGDTIKITVELANVGEHNGTEVAQLYVRDLVGNVTRPVKELKGFKRVNLQAGESQKVKFELAVANLSFYNEDMESVVEAGDFNLWVGGDSNAQLMATFKVE
ncbi:beta-glucosidase [Saccharicrinis carchari]|uniref:beta-glucosidase n=1 Tax=Saccharicrinis carchari TaxID=1168039 RepID=A0A521B9X6_SACCC|nr:beta-glucosidase BglX [Saccharicrinis carchari]SMO43906.1 beta-glucosidase [Saccharicrinis carchari]